MQLDPKILAEYSLFIKENTDNVTNVILGSFIRFLEEEIMENVRDTIARNNMQN